MQKIIKAHNAKIINGKKKKKKNKKKTSLILIERHVIVDSQLNARLTEIAFQAASYTKLQYP